MDHTDLKKKATGTKTAAGSRSMKRNLDTGIEVCENRVKKKATGTKAAAGSRSMKRNLDTGVEVCDNRVKKNKRHSTSEKRNMYKDINIIITNNSVRKTDLLQVIQIN